jgi:hypothetical protein
MTPNSNYQSPENLQWAKQLMTKKSEKEKIEINLISSGVGKHSPEQIRKWEPSLKR